MKDLVCFTCVVLIHTERYCAKFLNSDKDEVNKEWGSWLRAQPRRALGPIRNKYLRDDGDIGWEERQGRAKGGIKSGGRWDFPGIQHSQGIDYRHQLKFKGNESHPATLETKSIEFQGTQINSNFSNGPEEDELIGLQFVERKRMRRGPGNFEVMDTECGLMAANVNEKLIENSDV